MLKMSENNSFGKIMPLTMILWTKQFETGLEKIDQQHQMLISKINHLEEQLHNTNPTREECEFVTQLVDFLESYADTHFKLEEACMARQRCPAHAQNKQGHERFRGFFRDYKRRCEVEGYTVELLRNLHDAASSWIKDHILKIDTQLRC
jgi:hemerythrin